MNKNIVSKCCKAPLKVVGGDEGTNHFECTKCHKAADMYSGDKVNANKPKDQSAIERFDKEFELHDLGKDEFTLCHNNSDDTCDGGISIARENQDEAERHLQKVKAFLSKELSLAEQRGREEAIEDVGKQLQEKWGNDPRSEKDKKIGGSNAWRLGYLQALRDTSVDMRKLKKGNQTLDKV